MNKLLLAVVMGAALAVGCAAPTDEPTTPESSESDLAAFKFRYLASFTENDVCDAYARTLSRQLGEAKTANPDVKEVSVAGVSAFAGMNRPLLGGSLRWYFQTQKQSSIKVADITRTMMAIVRPAVKASVGADGFVQGSKLNGAVPPEMVWSVDDARYDAAMRAVNPPSDIDIRETFANARAEFDHEGLFLPVEVNKKPTAKQLNDVFGLDMGTPVKGAKAKEAIAQVFDGVILREVLASKAIKEHYYLMESGGDWERHVAIFLDEHHQLWGFSITWQAD